MDDDFERSQSLPGMITKSARSKKTANEILNGDFLTMGKAPPQEATSTKNSGYHLYGLAETQSQDKEERKSAELPSSYDSFDYDVPANVQQPPRHYLNTPESTKSSFRSEMANRRAIKSRQSSPFDDSPASPDSLPHRNRVRKRSPSQDSFAGEIRRTDYIARERAYDIPLSELERISEDEETTGPMLSPRKPPPFRLKRPSPSPVVLVGNTPSVQSLPLSPMYHDEDDADVAQAQPQESFSFDPDINNDNAPSVHSSQTSGYGSIEAVLAPPENRLVRRDSPRYEDVMGTQSTQPLTPPPDPTESTDDGSGKKQLLDLFQVPQHKRAKYNHQPLAPSNVGLPVINMVPAWDGPDFSAMSPSSDHPYEPTQIDDPPMQVSYEVNYEDDIVPTQIVDESEETAAYEASRKRMFPPLRQTHDTPKNLEAISLLPNHRDSDPPLKRKSTQDERIPDSTADDNAPRETSADDRGMPSSKKRRIYDSTSNQRGVVINEQPADDDASEDDNPLGKVQKSNKGKGKVKTKVVQSAKKTPKTRSGVVLQDDGYVPSSIPGESSLPLAKENRQLETKTSDVGPSSLHEKPGRKLPIATPRGRGHHQSVAGPSNSKASEISVNPSLPSETATRVFAKWSTHFYPATITGRRAKGAFYVRYDDGDTGEATLTSLRKYELRAGDKVVNAKTKVSGTVVRMVSKGGGDAVLVDAENKQMTYLVKEIYVRSADIKAHWEDRKLQDESIVPEALVATPKKEHAASPVVSLTSSRATGVPTRRPLTSQLFILTKSEDDTMERISRLGGKVIPKWSEILRADWTEENGVYTLKRQNVYWIGDEVTKGLFLVAENHFRTPKYLTALALGVPCLDVSLLNAYTPGKASPDWRKFLLPKGHCVAFNTLVSQSVDLNWDSNFRPENLMNNAVPPRFFEDMKILCVGECFVKDDCALGFLIAALGAAEVTVMAEIPESIVKDAFAWIIVPPLEDEEYPAVYHTLPSEKTISFHLIRDSLIAGRLLPRQDLW